MGLCLCAVPVPLPAATRAGTTIANTATMTWSADGQDRTAPSNTVSLVTAEVLDVTIAADRAQLTTGAGQTAAIGFIVTNSGNGHENFALTIASDQPGVAVDRIALDSDKDGVYDPAKDQVLATGAPLALAAGEQARIFVLVDGAQIAAASSIQASVAATTGSGKPGTVFAGAGDDGGDAIIGQTTAAASARTLLTPVGSQPSLVKSQSVLAPDGSARAVRGAIITYALVASFPGATRGAVIDDPIPAGTDYVPGSLSLDGRTVSEAADADAGSVGTGGVHVALGDAAAAATHTVQFSVKIQ